MTNGLFGKDKEIYGDKYHDHLLEQYKLYVHSVDQISERRQKNNDFFIAINTVILTILGFLGKQFEISNLIYFFISFSGAIICIFWYLLIKSYKDINTGKFEVLHKIEENLPLKLYKYEWQILGEGQDRKTYLPVSHIENKIPWVFMIFYLLIIFSKFDWHGILTTCIQ